MVALGAVIQFIGKMPSWPALILTYFLKRSGEGNRKGPLQQYMICPPGTFLADEMKAIWAVCWLPVPCWTLLPEFERSRLYSSTKRALNLWFSSAALHVMWETFEGGLRNSFWERTCYSKAMRKGPSASGCINNLWYPKIALLIKVIIRLEEICVDFSGMTLQGQISHT